MTVPPTRRLPESNSAFETTRSTVRVERFYLCARWCRAGRSILPNSQADQFFCHGPGPVSVRGRAGRARMQDLANSDVCAGVDRPTAVGGEASNADQPFGLQQLNHSAQIFVAHGEQGIPFLPRQFVRRMIASAGGTEGERTIIRNEMFGKEPFRRPETVSDQSPKPPAADFRTRTIKTQHRPFGMLMCRRIDAGMDLHPVPNRRNFAERHAGLYHAKWPGIHAHENNPFSAAGELPQILFMDGPGIIEGIVNGGDWWMEFEAVNRRRQTACCPQQRFVGARRFQARSP